MVDDCKPDWISSVDYPHHCRCPRRNWYCITGGYLLGLEFWQRLTDCGIVGHRPSHLRLDRRDFVFVTQVLRPRTSRFF